MQFEKQQFESDCLNKIAQDRQEVDIFIRELDQLKGENAQVDDEQQKVMDLIRVTEQDVFAASHELADLRHQCSAEDMATLNLRKEIEH